MKKLLRNQRFIKAVEVLRPWVIFIVVFVILRYTCAVAGISSLTNTALVNIGMKDVNQQEESFNYNFKIRNKNGEEVDVNQFKGKTIFLNLWATWCGPCRAEMPSIQGLYDKMDKDKIVFIMLDWQEDPSVVSKFTNKKGYTFPVYFFSKEGAPSQLNVPSIPTTFIISPAGKIVTKKAGTADYDTNKFKKFLEDMSL